MDTEPERARPDLVRMRELQGRVEVTLQRISALVSELSAAFSQSPPGSSDLQEGASPPPERSLLPSGD